MKYVHYYESLLSECFNNHIDKSVFLDNGLKPRPSIYSNLPDYYSNYIWQNVCSSEPILSAYQISVLNGILASDGTIRHDYDNFVISQSSIHIYYIIELCFILCNVLASSTCYDLKISASGNNVCSLVLATNTHVRKMKYEWYIFDNQKREKIFPSSFLDNLNANTFVHLVCGDGTSRTLNTLVVCTQGIAEYYNKLLCESIAKAFGVRGDLDKLIYVKSTNELYISAKAFITIRNHLIKNNIHIPNGFSYKFNIQSVDNNKFDANKLGEYDHFMIHNHYGNSILNISPVGDNFLYYCIICEVIVHSRTSHTNSYHRRPYNCTSCGLGYSHHKQIMDHECNQKLLKTQCLDCKRYFYNLKNHDCSSKNTISPYEILDFDDLNEQICIKLNDFYKKYLKDNKKKENENQEKVNKSGQKKSKVVGDDDDQIIPQEIEFGSLDSIKSKDLKNKKDEIKIVFDHSINRIKCSNCKKNVPFGDLILILICSSTNTRLAFDKNCLSLIINYDEWKCLKDLNFNQLFGYSFNILTSEDYNTISNIFEIKIKDNRPFSKEIQVLFDS